MGGMDGGRLRILRLSRGMSLDDLSSATNQLVSKQMLSRYERGLSVPTSQVVSSVAKALGVPTSRLLESPRLEIKPIGYRKDISLGKGDQSRITSLLMNELEQRVRVQEANGADTMNLPILKMDASTLEDAETRAEQIRKLWGLGEAPIMSVVDELECRFVHVLEVEAPETFDGLSLVAFDESGKPVAVAAGIRKGMPGDRQRLSLAHELGHILLNLSPSLDEEKAAYRFASAFLVPKSALFREVGTKRSSVDLTELAMLKRRYKISLQAVVYRLRELEIISDNHGRNWFEEIQRRGWKKVEPWEVPSEEPMWLKRNVHRAVAEGVFRRDDGKAMLDGDMIDEDFDGTSELLELAQMTKEERKRLLEQSVAESLKDYDLDEDWLSADLGEVS